MNFINDDINSLKQNGSKFKNNYESDFSLFSRRLLLAHTLHYLIFIKNKLKLNQEDGQ